MTKPEGDNALLTYREIAEIDPQNTAAENGRVAIKKSYERWAEGAIAKGDPLKALAYFDRAEYAWNDDDLRRRIRRLRDAPAKNRIRRLNTRAVSLGLFENSYKAAFPNRDQIRLRTSFDAAYVLAPPRLENRRVAMRCCRRPRSKGDDDGRDSPRGA